MSNGVEVIVAGDKSTSSELPGNMQDSSNTNTIHRKMENSKGLPRGVDSGVRNIYLIL